MNVFENITRRISHLRNRLRDNASPQIRFADDGKVDRRMGTHGWTAIPYPELEVVPSKADYLLGIVQRVYDMKEGTDEATYAYMDHLISAEAESWRKAVHITYQKQVESEQNLHVDEESLPAEKHMEAALLVRDIHNLDANYVAARNRLLGEDAPPTTAWNSVLATGEKPSLPTETPQPGKATVGRTVTPEASTNGLVDDAPKRPSTRNGPTHQSPQRDDLYIPEFETRDSETGMPDEEAA